MIDRVMRHDGVMHLAAITLAAAMLLSLGGCERGGSMVDQPRGKPMGKSDAFDNGAASRPLPPGVVPRSADLDHPALTTGMVDDHYVTQIPLKVDAALLARGRQRFDIDCSMCHGYDGYGKGIVIERGFTQPPSFHNDRLRTLPVGYLFSVITHGFGRMGSYAQQVKLRDRWAIVAYIRALQLSQHAAAEQLPADVRAKVLAANTATPPTHEEQPSP